MWCGLTFKVYSICSGGWLAGWYHSVWWTGGAVMEEIAWTDTMSVEMKKKKKEK